MLLLVLLGGLLHLQLCFHIREMGSTAPEGSKPCPKTELIRRKAVKGAQEALGWWLLLLMGAGTREVG